MIKKKHLSGKESCPYLPSARRVWSPSDSRELRCFVETDRAGEYQRALLCCAQSLWLQGKPAQALLQLNHVLSMERHGISEGLPYRAKLWLFTHREEGCFIGNPVRHYQHLASRVVGAHKQLRSWRAWACFHLAERVLSPEEFPRDTRQVTQENLHIPSIGGVLENLVPLTTHEEVAELRVLLCSELPLDLRQKHQGGHNDE
ncbi:MAG: hypothetical protein ACPG32_12065 [Akkermansiaceae bacterium]